MSLIEFGPEGNRWQMERQTPEMVSISPVRKPLPPAKPGEPLLVSWAEPPRWDLMAEAVCYEILSLKARLDALEKARG